MPTFDGSTSYLRQAHFTPAAVFNPAVGGAITNIGGGFSQGSFTNNNGVIFETGLILRQSGSIYWPSGFQAYGLQGATGWYGSSTLYQNMGSPSNWELVNGTAHPNFSSSGAPIEFGFWTGYYFWSDGGTCIDGVDNWAVNITSTPIPEPAAVILLGVCLLPLLARKRLARQDN